MAWIILEGLDRTGKSTVADLYKRSGYEVVHMNAPDKKYSQPGYTGPSYLDEMLDIYMRYTNRDVIFDRSIYGEFVWPFVYNRKAQLSDDDLEILQDLENANMAERYLMYDADAEAHWKRCVANKEPLNRPQFNQANIYFEKMSRKYNFEKRQLADFSALQKSVAVDLAAKEETKGIEPTFKGAPLLPPGTGYSPSALPPEILKLQKANAINDVLAKRIIKQKGDMYDALERDVRDFLVQKLSTIFGEDKTNKFSEDEVQILKIYVKQLKQKLEAKK